MIKGYGIIGFEQSVVFPFFFFLSISRIDGRLYIHISMYFSLSSKKICVFKHGWFEAI